MLVERQGEVDKFISQDLPDDLKIEFSKSGDVIRQQAGERLLANKLRDINKAIDEIKAADTEDFSDAASERPGTSYSIYSRYGLKPTQIQS